MTRLLGSLFALAIVIGFSMTTGCTPAKDTKAMDMDAMEGDAKKFSTEKDGSLDKKDATFEATFKNGKPKSVKPDDDKNVSAKVDGEKVIFKQLVDAPEKDIVVEFTVMGGKEDKEEAKVKVTVKKKA